MTAVKAGLERWFDGTMDSLESAYKNRATMWLFTVGLVIAVASNASRL